MLNDPILEGRKQRNSRNGGIQVKYIHRILKNLGKINLALKTEKNLLELRKNQIEEYIMAKRSLSFNENSLYLINPNCLIIPDEMKIDLKMFLEQVILFKLMID